MTPTEAMNQIFSEKGRFQRWLKLVGILREALETLLYRLALDQHALHAFIQNAIEIL